MLAIVTLGIYTWVWTFKTYDEMKKHTGSGLGGGVGLLLHILIGIVTFFVVPSEIKSMYANDGRQSPVSPVYGLLVLLPLIGPIIWFVSVNGALNDYWTSKATVAAPVL